MEIYTYHSDLLLSLRYFFDNFIFHSNTIKGYQFNIGDRSLQIKNDPKFDLPRVIINYNSNHSVWYRPYTWTRTDLNNAAVPVLYNRTKNLTLEVHEELFEFQISVIINCESQLSALHIEHLLQNKLILNKYFSIYNYYSFIEIEPQFLTPQMFNVNTDDILNLFVKYNAVRNLTEYCYSIKYSPTIRMDSIDVPIGSTDQRSFSVNLGLTVLNHIPVYHDIPGYERRHTPIKSLKYKNVIVPNENLLISILLTDKNNIETKTSTICEYDSNGKFISPFISSDNAGYVQSGRVTGYIQSIEYFGIFTFNIKDSPIRANCTLSYNIKNKLYFAKLSGGAIGIITPVFIIDSNISEFTGMFSGIVNSIFHKFEISGTFVLDYKSYSIKDSSVSFLNSSIPIIKYDIQPMPLGKLYHYFKDVDPRFISIIVEKTIFKKAIFKSEDNIYEVFISEYILDKGGNFLININFLDINNESISESISGKIDSESVSVDYSTSINMELLFLVCDFELKSSIGHGSLHIERININIVSDSNYSPIIMDPIYFSFYNSKISTPEISKKLYRTVILAYSDFDKIFIFDNKDVIITIELDQLFDYPTLISSNNIYWSFYIGHKSFSYKIYDSLSSGIQILDRVDSDLNNVLKFKCTREIYESYFSYLDIDHPIIFQIFLVN